jgi:DNA-binding protein H-NS
MAKIPDLSGLNMEELAEVVAAANQRTAELKKARISELQAQKSALDAELTKLGAGVITLKAPKADDGRKRASPPPMYRTPTGEEWSGRGAIPRFFKAIGVKEKGEMEKYRIKN